MLWLYRILSSAVHGVMYPYGRLRASRGSQLWQGRLGEFPATEVDLWFHAASVGEIKVVAHLIQYLKRLRPQLRVAVTTMTEMGFNTAGETLDDSIIVRFFPIDSAPLISRVMSRLAPRMIVIAETEIWPNLVLQAAKRGIPLVLVNARLSERAFGRYRMISKTMSRLLSCYDRLFLKSEADLERFRTFNIPSERLIIAGDMKFDAPLVARTSIWIAETRFALGVAESDYLLVAGSTRPGEEEALLDVYRDVRVGNPRLRLLLAPRHLERLPEVEALIDSRGFPRYRYGQPQPDTSPHPSDGIVVVDRMGILNDLYAVADMAFVGGTLVDIGGHNVLEPVWARTPVLFGPSTANVRDAVEYILEHKYGAQVADAAELSAELHDSISGKKTFNMKTDTEIDRSATALAGNYILERLDGA